MRNLTEKKIKTNLINCSASCTMDQMLESKGESGDSMVANLGEEEQTQKGKEVGDQQKEQQAEVEATEEDDHDEEEEEEEEEDDQEDDWEEEDDNEDKTATEHFKSVPKVTNTSKEFYIYIYIYIYHTNSNAS